MIVQATPAITTQLTQASITVGATDFDTANISSDFVPGGTRRLGDLHGVQRQQLRRIGSGRWPLAYHESNGGVPNSAALTFNSAGTFYWVATFSGDSNNAGPVSSVCTAEPMMVGTARRRS